jgi:hypothetical protein
MRWQRERTTPRTRTKGVGVAVPLHVPALRSMALRPRTRRVTLRRRTGTTKRRRPLWPPAEGAARPPGPRAATVNGAQRAGGGWSAFFIHVAEVFARFAEGHRIGELVHTCETEAVRRAIE